MSAAGLGVDCLWGAALAGNSQVSKLDIPRAEKLRVRIAASVEGFSPENHLSKSEIIRTDRFAQFAHVAATEAISQAALGHEDLATSRTAVIIGSGIGGMHTIDDNCYVLFTGRERLHPMMIARAMPSAATSHVSIVHGVTGPSFGVTSACSSGSQAIGIGMQMIRSGIIDRAIVGGSEACITPSAMKAWEVMRVLSPDKCRPFSSDRNGMVLGEGAAIFVLESKEAIQKRNVQPVAWLAGYGTTSDARDIIQPDANGAAKALTLAMQDADLSPSDIGYVNAHGTGTVLNDLCESQAISTVFGDLVSDLPVSSTKPITGHTLGASGALELIVAIKSLQTTNVPPNINLDDPDPRCALNLPCRPMTFAKGKAVLSNTFAFGGINSALILAPVE